MEGNHIMRDSRQLQETLLADGSAEHQEDEQGTTREDENTCQTNDDAVIHLVTYGKRFGSINKAECQEAFNCTIIPNPEAKRTKGVTGLSKRFRDEVMRQDVAVCLANQAVARISDDFQQRKDGKSSLRYAFYCEHGKHRSLSVAETVARELRSALSILVEVQHRDVNRTFKKERRR